MGNKTSLFNLVKSLTPAEKRYFKLFAGLHGKKEKLYILLFNAIDKQKVYNEKALQNKFCDSRNSSNFSMIKSYLYAQIIAALKAYSSYKDYESELNDELETYKILRQKGLYSDAAELLQHCKQFAYANGLYMRLYYIITEEIIVILFSKITVSYNPTISLARERLEILKIIENYSLAGDILYNQKLFLRTKNYARTPDEKKILDKNIRPMMKWQEKHILSRIALGMYNQAMSDYYNAIGDITKAFYYIRKDLVEKLEQYNVSKAEKTYYVEVGHYLQLCLRNKHFPDFTKYLNEYKKLISPKMSPVELLIYETALHAEISYHNLNDNHAEALAVFTKDKRFSILQKRISKKGLINILYAVAVAHFGLGDFRAALRYVNQVIDLADVEVEELIFARILSIIIYFERENIEGLESALRSTYRILLRNKRNYETETLLLKFIRKAGKLDTKNDVAKLFSQLHLDLNKLFLETPMEKTVEYYFNFRGWLGSKLALV
ncbi:MAG: hypothetical protein IPP64_14820 [Bacteroidetes bacterium]|nr:hypothetical protein [Bacteroidota bacterium]